MAEESLNVKVVPEIEDSAIQDLSQKLSGVMVNITGNVRGRSSGSSSEDTAGSEEDKTAMADGIVQGLKNAGKDPEATAGIMKPLTDNQKDAAKTLGEMDGTAKDNAQNAKEQTSVFGKISEGLAFGVGFAIEGWGVLKKIFNIIASSEGPLKDVLSLFSTIFGLFLLPLNLALTQILIPYVQELASSMSVFVSEMMEVYKNDGLGGLIVATFGKLVEVFLPMLIKMVEYTGTVIMTVLRQIWNSGNLAKAIMVLAVSIPAFLLASQIFQTVQTAQMTSANLKLTGILTDFFTCNTLALTRTATTTAVATPLLAVLGPLLLAIGAILAIAEAVSFLTTGKGFFANLLGFADGGVFEPNDEKIIRVGDNTQEQEIVAPKSTIVSAVNEALNTNNNVINSSSTSSGTVINATFNITSNDPEAVAKEVEKQLSKMMDNSLTRWGV